MSNNKQSDTDILTWFPFLKSALEKHTMFSVLNPDGIITYVNDKLCEISEFDRDELIGNSYRLMASGNHPKSFFRSMSDTIHKGSTWRGEVENRTKSGSFYWIDCTVCPFTDDSARIAGFIVIETDITKNKNSEVSLRSSLDLLKSIFENFPGGISYTSKDLVLELSNKMT